MRVFILIVVMMAMLASSAGAATFHVNSAADIVDSAPGNGACATATATCTLRAAVMEANATPGTHRIVVPHGTYGLALPPTPDDVSGGDLDIGGGGLVIEGHNATVNAHRIDRVFENTSSAPVTISGVAVTGGLAVEGGGVLSEGDAPLTLVNTTISGNEAQHGGGVGAVDATTLKNVTIANNTGGGIFKVGDSHVEIGTTIVAGNHGGNCIFEPGTLPIVSRGANLDSGVTCKFDNAYDVSNTRPLLVALHDGVHSLHVHSPAIDRAGNGMCPTTDQRGGHRPRGLRCDIGAYERDTTQDPPSTCQDRSIRAQPADLDSTVDQGDPTKNFGTDATLKVRSALNVNARAVMHFPLPGIPSGCVIVGTWLTLNAGGAVDGRSLQVQRLTSQWNEHTVAWLNQPALTGVSASAPSALGIVMWPTNDQVYHSYQNGNFGLGVRDADENQTGEQVFDSREGPPPPVLSIVMDSPSGVPGAPGGPGSPGTLPPGTTVPPSTLPPGAIPPGAARSAIPVAPGTLAAPGMGSAPGLARTVAGVKACVAQVARCPRALRRPRRPQPHFTG